MPEVVCSAEMRAYFESLMSQNDHCYCIAGEARAQGRDPQTSVEIPQAEDLAARVEKQLAQWNIEGAAERIRALSANVDSREEVSLLVAKEVASWPSKSREEAIEKAVRVGLSVLTEGILVAPIVGIGGIKIGKNADGSEYLSIFFNGPIRAAGGTGQAMSVLIGDVVRREFGIGRYIPTEGEVERLKEEIPLYKQCQHLQYAPTNEEIDLIYRNCPVCVDGEKTEDMEISGYRDLPRVSTNAIRGGVCLVVAEGLCLKAPKLEKHVKKLKMDGWDFISQYLKMKKGSGKEEAKIAPDYKYLKDIVGGRPVLGHPSRPGGFRLRYGRGRTTGLAALAINPATMHALGSFLAVGTQIKIERPGKAGAVTPCDRLEGPTLLLKNGDLVQTNTVPEFLLIKDEVKEIVDVGQVLLPFGEFVENNHLLVQGDYTIEWHKQEMMANGAPLPDDWEHPDFLRSLEISRQHGVPLHPDHNLFWSDIGLEELRRLRQAILERGATDGNGLRIRPSAEEKRTLELLGALHACADGDVLVGRHSQPLLRGLGLRAEDGAIAEDCPLEGGGALDAVSRCTGVRVMPRSVTRIGSRMGRPEKAKERKMKPPPHSLFPIGNSGGPQRLINKAAAAGQIKVKVGVRTCPGCGMHTISCRCECGEHTVQRAEPEEKTIDLYGMLCEATQNLGERGLPAKMKGVIGLISKDRTPEALEKGILRKKNDIYVYKDGTVRFDMTDVPLTHFRPREIGLSVEKAHEIGYARDCHGEPLVHDEQVCELKVQDIIPSTSCGDFLVRVTRFVDELLEKYYRLPSFYRCRSREDLIGHLAIGLAPHTSGGILCRIIGYSDANVCYGHPFFHASKRRNADGDEDCIMLLLDGLLNFSRSYLPDSRGGLMDAPLVLAIRLDPNEIDKEAHNLDLRWEYPLELYQASMEQRHPKDVQAQMDLVGERIKTMLQYEGFGYTFDTDDIAAGPLDSEYKVLETMKEKMDAQLELGRMLRAVDVEDVAHRIISKHFLPDLIGNLRSFSGQKVRCTKCNESYRRVPLAGVCKCGNRLTLTVYEASVRKYLTVTKNVGRDYGISNYTQQRVEQIESNIVSLFGESSLQEEPEDVAVRCLESFSNGEEEAMPEAAEDDPPAEKAIVTRAQDEPLQAQKKERPKARSLDEF
jgi:DNA polymerase II large subunit